jgi:hypothetical protein
VPTRQVGKSAFEAAKSHRAAHAAGGSTALSRCGPHICDTIPHVCAAHLPRAASVRCHVVSGIEITPVTATRAYAEF